MGTVAYQKLKDTSALPSPAGVALELLRLTSDEDVTLASIGKVVESDPALAARILKLVNSPYAGVNRNIASVSEAVAFLGLRPVRNLALGLSLLSGNCRGGCQGFDYQAFWSETLARAVAARRLAMTLKTFPPDEAFAAGLVGNIGSLALATVHSDEYSHILASGCNTEEIALREREAFGLDHNVLSAEMMSEWWLQDYLCQAVRFQDALGQAGAQCDARVHLLARILHLAAITASILMQQESGAGLLDLQAKEARELGISEAAFAPMFNAIASEWRDAGTVFSVSTMDVLTLDELRARARKEHAAAQKPSEEIRILIVDDDPSMLRLIEKYLSGRGYRLITASSGLEALEADRREAPQMVITDWMMPDVNGLELCRQLRAQEESGFVHILVLTAQSEKEKVVQALDAGADDFLAKPFTREELLAHVRSGERIVRLEAQLSDRSLEIARINATLAATNERLRMMATTDELTSLTNRREGLTRLAEYWSMADREGQPLSCIIADIDFFKRFNDTYGHAAGDTILRATASALVRTARSGELVCRLGGEEFLIICPRATATSAAAAAERMRLATAAHKVKVNEDELSVTISMGVAGRSNCMTGPDDLLKVADDMLYAAKNAGRNRFCAPAV